jgi:hypothetical protein
MNEYDGVERLEWNGNLYVLELFQYTATLKCTLLNRYKTHKIPKAADCKGHTLKVMPSSSRQRRNQRNVNKFQDIQPVVNVTHQLVAINGVYLSNVKVMSEIRPRGTSTIMSYP